MSSQLVRKFRTLSDLYSAKGFFELCKHVFAQTLRYDRLFIFEKNLSQPVCETQPKIPVDWKVLPDDDGYVDKLVEFWPDFYAPLISTPLRIKESIICRLAAGEKCLIAVCEGKIINMSWIGFSGTHQFNEYVGKKGLGEGEGLIYNRYTDPKYRSNGVFGAAMAQSFRYLQRKGCGKALAYTGSKNKVALRTDHRIFVNNTGVLHIVRLFGFDKYFLVNKVRNARTS